MNFFILICTIFICDSIWAGPSYAYKILDSSYIEVKNSIHEIIESSPIKTQDGLGLCYGFSSTSLLETYRCQQLKLDCKNPHETLSVLDVSSHYSKQSLEEGGSPQFIFSNILKSNRLIAREECIPFLL